METTSSPRTLLILGNGFDLSLKIKSQYSDFYKSNFFKKNYSVWSYIIPALIPNAESADWMDIESAIATVLLSPNYGILKSYKNSKLPKAINFIDKSVQRNRNLMWGEITVPEEYSIPSDETDIVPLVFTIAKIFHTRDYQNLYEIIEELSNNPYSKIEHYRQGPKTKDSPSTNGLASFEDKLNDNHYEFLSLISDFLLNELKILEQNFQEYLNSQLDSTYSTKASEKITQLIKKFDSPNIGNTTSDVSILSFNYTNLNNTMLYFTSDNIKKLGEADIFSDDMLFPQKSFNVTNIHGTLEKNNIIFGIDSHDDKKLQDKRLQVLVQPFTKASRKLRITEPSQFNIDTNIKNVVFFGHSLSEADYSYFEYIFNAVHLYSSECNLIFKYATAYDINNKQKIKGEICSAVEKLIRKYQDSLPANQQNDLFNRLLIQGRIQVIDIDEEIV